MRATHRVSVLSRHISENRYILAGLSFALVSWFVESALHAGVFSHGTFWAHVFTDDIHEIWMRLVVGAMFVSFGLSTQRAVSVLKRNQQALILGEQKRRTLVEEALNPIFVLGELGQFLDVNTAALDFFETDRDQLLSLSYQDVSGSGSTRALHDSPVAPEIGQSEVDFLVKGTQKTLLLNIVLQPVSYEETLLYYGIGQDITERKQIELNLKSAHEELNQIFQTASTGMRLIDKDFNVLKVNETFVEMSGVPREESVGSKCYEIFSGERCHSDQCPMKGILDHNDVIEYEIKDKTKMHGAELSCLLTARPFSDHDGKVTGIVESFKDITELSNVREKLRTERDKLSHILFQQSEGVSIMRSDYIIEYQNATLTEQLGDCTGETCYKAFKNLAEPCSPCCMRKAFQTGRLQRCEFDAEDGRSFEHTYTPFCDTDLLEKAVVYIRDVSDIKASRASAFRSEKLAGVGELATGVAHEINNPINGIINFAQMLIDQNEETSTTHDLASWIVREGDRIARIVAGLLSFTRGGSDVKIPTSLYEILVDSLTLIGTQFRKDAIRMEINFPENLPPVFCIPQEIQQVFLNILNNARYALNQRFPNGDGNKVLEIQASSHGSNGDCSVRISFRDSGLGIPPELIDKIVNPFFSTKPKGEGTGLGLSISQDIVRSHGGELGIKSQPGEYTAISVELPAVTG